MIALYALLLALVGLPLVIAPVVALTAVEFGVTLRPRPRIRSALVFGGAWT